MDKEKPKAGEDSAHHSDDSDQELEASSSRMMSVQTPMADGHMVRERKRQRFEAKQERRVKRQLQQDKQSEWIQQHASLCLLVTRDEVNKVQSGNYDAKIDRCRFLEPYLHLQEPNEPTNGGEKIFIAEGTETVRLLLQQLCRDNTPANSSQRRSNSYLLPPIQVQSIFVKPSVLFDPPVSLISNVEQAWNSIDAFSKETGRNSSAIDNSSSTKSLQPPPPPFHVLVGNEDVQSAIAGFHFSRGALACGIVPEYTEDWFFDVYGPSCDNGLRVLALDGIADTANLGSIIRCAAAFGIHGILLSRDCCDPWYRRAVRVSMGHVFNVPCVRVRDLASSLRRLAGKNEISPNTTPGTARKRTMTVYAAVVDPNADLTLEQMDRGKMIMQSLRHHVACSLIGCESAHFCICFATLVSRVRA